MWIINSIFGVVVDLALFPFREMSPMIGLTCFSLAAGVGMLYVFKWTSDQKGLEDVGIASDKARPQARHVAALGQAGQRDQAFEVRSPELRGRLQAAQGRLVAKIDFAVALV